MMCSSRPCIELLIGAALNGIQSRFSLGRIMMSSWRYVRSVILLLGLTLKSAANLELRFSRAAAKVRSHHCRRIRQIEAAGNIWSLVHWEFIAYCTLSDGIYWHKLDVNSIQFKKVERGEQGTANGSGSKIQERQQVNVIDRE